MELREGYKLTEVGCIPSDWSLKNIGEIASVTSGGTPNRKIPAFWGGDIPWITTALIDGSIIYSAVEYITDEGVKGSAAKWIESGTLLMAMYGQGKTRGKVGMLGIRATINQACAAITVKNTIYPEYLLHYLRGRYTAIRELSNAGGQENLSGGIIRTFLVPCPSKEEQRAIATALSDMDALLEGLDQLIAKKRDLKQATMQQLLTGKIRLPGFCVGMRLSGDAKDGKEPIEGEWKVKRLEQLADIRSGGTPSTSQPNLWDGGILWCTPTDITALQGKKYLDETNRTISPSGLRSSSAETIPVHSIIMTTRATIGECAINIVPMTTNQGFKNLVPYDDVDYEFLYYLMTMHKEQLIALCAGSTFLEIGKKQLSGFEIRLPSTKEEQTAIANILSDMDAEIEALLQRRTKTRDLKQAMMHELLTGRTRLI